MSLPLPTEIEIEDRWPEFISYRLPRRDLKGLRWLGAAFLVAGLALAAGIAIVLVAMLNGVQQGWHRHIFGYLMFFALPTCGGLLPIWWGLSLLIGCNELRLCDGYLRRREYLGPFFWSKRWKVDAITTMSITSIFNVKDPSRLPPWLHHFDSLKCSGGGLKEGVLAWGYQPTLLEPLGVAVAERCDRLTTSTPMPDASPRKPIGVYSDYNKTLKVRLTAEEMRSDDVDDWDADDEEAEEVEDRETAASLKPADTLIEWETYDDGLTIKVPPAGLWRGTSGLFAFSLIWNGAMLLFTTLCVLALVRNQPNDDGGAWIAMVFFFLFWTIGIGLLCGAVNMGKRKAAIAVAGDMLMVIQTGPFGVKRKEWPLADLTEIITGPSGMQVNDVDVLELQIHSHSGPKFGMLAGRKDAELYWLASLLREATLTPRNGLTEPVDAAPNEDNP